MIDRTYIQNLSKSKVGLPAVAEFDRVFLQELVVALRLDAVALR